MTTSEAERELQQLQPVPPPPPGPTYEYAFGNQIRWTLKALRYERYRWRVRKLEKRLARG